MSGAQPLDAPYILRASTIVAMPLPMPLNFINWLPDVMRALNAAMVSAAFEYTIARVLSPACPRLRSDARMSTCPSMHGLCGMRGGRSWGLA